MNINNLKEASKINDKINYLHEVRRELENGAASMITITLRDCEKSLDIRLPMNFHCTPDGFPIVKGAIAQVKMMIERHMMELKDLGIDING